MFGRENMEVRILQNDKKTGKLSFLMKGTQAPFVNALRRIVMQEVPTLAVEHVEIKKNNSILYDEMIAHRLGLTPLTTDLESYDLPEKCGCEKQGCAKCQVKLVLKAKGGVVTADKLKPADPKINPAYPEMIITKLLKGQELELEATAMLGKGKDHIKWSSGHVWYSQQPVITVNTKSTKYQEMRDKYPPQIFDKKGLIDKNLIIDQNLVDACDGICDDIVKVSYNKESFIFNIEPFGQLPAKTMVVQASTILNEKLEAFATLIKE